MPKIDYFLLRRLPLDILHQLMLKAIFFDELASVRPLLEREVERRCKAGAGDSPAMANLLRVTPCQAAQALAAKWRERIESGDECLEIWRGDGLVLKYGRHWLELVSTPNESLTCHILPADACITVEETSASLEWEGGTLSLDRLTAEALIASGVKSQDSGKLAGLCAALTSNTPPVPVVAGGDPSSDPTP